MANHGRHPYLDVRQDRLLWSINERLAGRKGLDVPEPSSRWLDDIIEIGE